MFLNIDNNKKCFASITSAYKDDFWRIMWHWMMLKIQLCITLINYILKYIKTEKSYFKL